MAFEEQQPFDPASFEHIPVLLNECLTGLAIDRECEHQRLASIKDVYLLALLLRKSECEHHRAYCNNSATDDELGT